MASLQASTLFLLFACISSIAASAGSHWHERHPPSRAQNWLNHGGDIYNRRHAYRETKLSPSTASKLPFEWKFVPGKEINATPAIHDGILYFPSSNGSVYAVHGSNGSLVREKKLEMLTGYKVTRFQGRFDKLDATGKVPEKTFVLPDNHDNTGEYAGAGIWERRAPMDIHRNMVSFAADNTNSVPETTQNSQLHSHRPPSKPQNWLNHGCDIYNHRNAKNETKISPSTASKLRLKWEFFAGKDISATPAIYDGILYFPSWNGYVYAVHASNGSLVWEKKLETLTGYNATGFVYNVTTSVARATPTVAGDLLIVGMYGPAVVLALERANGNLVWSTRLDYHPAAVMTQSGTYYNGHLYIGVSSMEEGYDLSICCTFRGHFVKLDIKNGTVLWQTFMLPDNHNMTGEYAGAAIWGSSPPIDIHRNMVYVGTGNLYSAPQRIQECQAKQNNLTVPTQPDPCMESVNRENSVMGLDMDTGEIKWILQFGGYDVWLLACYLNASLEGCPVGPSPDQDFGEGPMMLTINVNGTKRDVVVAIQKNGYAWAIDRSNGTLVWCSKAGPGGVAGGGVWGSATDGKRIYTNIVNSGGSVFPTIPSSNETFTGGGWVALDVNTGEVLWSTADPANTTVNAPVSVANDVVFAGSTYATGPFHALDARTGKILWKNNTGATIYGGASVSDGCAFVGNGLKVGFLGSTATFSAGTSLFAYCVE